eukprot:scaffold32454_cov41-Attheya_sp.AAC.1
MVEHVLRNNLVSLCHFEWIVPFCNDNDSNEFVKPNLFRVAPIQRTDIHDILSANVPSPPGTQSKSLREENSQSQIVLPPILSSFP